MSVFDKEAFMHAEVQGEMETERTLPSPDEYLAMVYGCEAVERGDSPALNLTLDFIDEKALQDTGMDRVLLSDSLFLDIENGALALGKNKNTKLGQLREAVGQNSPGPWSPAMLDGAGPLKVKFDHRFNKDGDGPFPRFISFAKA